MQETGRGTTKGLTEETLDTEDFSLVPPDPLPEINVERNNDHEAEGRESLGSPSRRGIEGGPPDSGEANPFNIGRLQTNIQNFHRLNKGNMEYAGLLFSEIAQYLLPPRVVRRIFGCVDGTDTQLTPETFPASQLSAARLS